MTTPQHANVSQTFTVAGMTCSHCEMAVTAELGKLEGVTRISVDIPAGTVLTESTEPLSVDAVAAAVDEAGYELVVR